MSAFLAHDLVVSSPAAAREVVVFAHGILGSRNNWKSFARKLLERSGWSTLCVDLRNHGQSHGFEPPHTVKAAADDVSALCAHLGVRPAVVVGHSWGGKAMMQMALDNAGVDVAVAVDSPFGLRRQGGVREEIDRVLEAVAAVPLPVSSRKMLVEFLRERGLSEPVAQWMTTNLNDKMEWKFDLPSMGPMLSSFATLDLWPAVWAHRPSLAVHAIRGGLSDRFSTQELESLSEAANAGIVVEHVAHHAGHWVHTDDPEELLRMLVAALPA